MELQGSCVSSMCLCMSYAEPMGEHSTKFKLFAHLIGSFIKLLQGRCHGLAFQLFRQTLPGVAGPKGPGWSGLIVIAREDEGALLPAVQYPITLTRLPEKDKMKTCAWFFGHVWWAVDCSTGVVAAPRHDLVISIDLTHNAGA